MEERIAATRLAYKERVTIYNKHTPKLTNIMLTTILVLFLPLCVIVRIMITTNMGEVAQAVCRFSIFFLFLFDIVFLINSKRKFQWKYKELIVKRMVKELIETCELPEKYPGSSLRWT